MRRIVASDLHIGSRHADYEAIGRLFDIAEKESSELGLVGDIFELIFNSFERIVSNSEYAETVGHMKYLAKKIPVWIVPGNHDLELVRYREELKPVIVLEGPRIENGYLYTHGHEFDIMQKSMVFLYTWLAKMWPQLFWKIAKTPWLYKKVKEEEWNYFVAKIQAAALIYARRNGLKGIVMGHTHSPGIRLSPTLPEIVDCGDFVDSCTYLVEEENVRVRRKRDVRRLSSALKSSGAYSEEVLA